MKYEARFTESFEQFINKSLPQCYGIGYRDTEVSFFYCDENNGECEEFEWDITRAERMAKIFIEDFGEFIFRQWENDEIVDEWRVIA